MACAPAHLIIHFLAALHCSSAHAAATLGVEIARNGQVMMRQDSSKDGAVEAALAEVGATHEKPRYREAAEAFEKPSKIDDSFLGSLSLHMPTVIEESPWFYAAGFVGGSFAFMGIVCFYVQYEDFKDEEKRERMRNAARRQAVASAAMGVPRMGASFPQAVSPAAIRAAADAVVAAAARTEPSPMRAREPLEAAPKATAAAAARVAGNGMNALMNAMGNLTGMIAGENLKNSPELSTASGASSPRSQLSAAQSRSSRSSKYSGSICNGSVLLAQVDEVIFASSSSWQEIGALSAGQHVIAAGPPEVADAYTMVPIKPKGAVDLKTLVVQEY